ncbi:hypothetical protein ACE198_14670 [Neobacillus sp. KR4-4]|uniref:hypothetical protein n=1 Tax=Neobacillus sp. KR4-4 TaxID=3344872 RepID=UPI0035CA1F62
MYKSIHHFRMRGIMKDRDNQKAREVLYKDGKLTGDKLLVEVIEASAGYSKDARIEAKEVMKVMNDVCTNAVVWGEY